MSLKFIISGGGTGGHIFPALSIANEIRKRDPGASILFVGALDRMEMEKVPAAGFPIMGLPVEGLHRKIGLRNFVVLFKLIVSLFKAGKILKNLRGAVNSVRVKAQTRDTYRQRKIQIPAYGKAS